MEKSVSIIIPVYNGAKYLPQCLDSLLCQDYRNFKIILINDGSKDNSASVIEEYVKKDDRITFINNTVNRGQSFTRNCGLENLDSEYFTFIDCDDWVESNYISTLVSLHDENTLLTACGFKYQKRSTRHFKNKNSEIKQFDVNQALCEVISDKNLFGVVWNKLYKTALLKDLRFLNNLGAGEDLVFNIYYLLNNRSESGTVRSTNAKLYHYVATQGHESGLSCSIEKYNKQKTIFQALEDIKNLPALVENKEFRLRINSWLFLMSLQFIFFSKKVKLPKEKKNFKTMAKNYLADYKTQIDNYSIFRKQGVLLYGLTKLL